MVLHPIGGLSKIWALSSLPKSVDPESSVRTERVHNVLFLLSTLDVFRVGFSVAPWRLLSKMMQIGAVFLTLTLTFDLFNSKSIGVDTLMMRIFILSC